MGPVLGDDLAVANDVEGAACRYGSQALEFLASEVMQAGSEDDPFVSVGIFFGSRDPLPALGAVQSQDFDDLGDLLADGGRIVTPTDMVDDDSVPDRGDSPSNGP